MPVLLCVGNFMLHPLRFWWNGHYHFFPSVSQWHSWDSNPRHGDCWTRRLPTKPCARSLRTAWNIMQRNAYIKMSIPGWPPLIQTHRTMPLVSCKAWTQIIPCCVIIVVKISTIYFHPVRWILTCRNWWKTWVRCPTIFRCRCWCFYWFHSLYTSILFFSYSLNDATFIPLFNAHDILSTHASSFFHLFSIFKHLGREKFKINNNCIYALIIYWEMAHVMRNGSYIEDSVSPATNIAPLIASFGGGCSLCSPGFVSNNL